MTNEMELLRRACPERVVADTPAVERARRSLSIAMANEAFVLPSEDESSAIDPNPHVATIVPSSNPRRRRMRLVAVGTSVAATFAIAGVILVPTGSQVPAAAASLRHISAVAAVQSLPSPGPGQDYFNQVRVSIFDTVNGASGQSEAQATFTGVEDLWTTASGSGTGSVSWGTPQFSSAAAQAAWDAIPGSATDLGPTSGALFSYPQNSSTFQGILDVSQLPTDETALGQEIDKGTTGITAVDSVSAGKDTSFERIGMLLAGPDVGATPQLRSALFQVLSDLPGVSLLGPTATASGQMGTGFGAPSTGGSVSTLIVNPDTGALLELNYAPNTGPSPAGFTGLGTASAQASVSLTQSTKWVEPLQSTTVSTSSVPVVQSP
jgi:hypothetical protein